jgi:hypothetical protein
MARARTKASSRGGNSRRGSTASRSTSSQSRKSAAPAPAEVEVVEEEAGMGMEDGIVVLTTVILLTACLMVDYFVGSEFGTGMLF